MANRKSMQSLIMDRCITVTTGQPNSASQHLLAYWRGILMENSDSCVCGHEEEWRRLLIGVEEYFISSHGRVKSVRLNRIINQDVTRCGYYRFRYNGGRYRDRHMLVHRAIAMAFFGKPPDGCTQVNHKDFNRLHNCIGNIEWVTPKQNAEHQYGSGRLQRRVTPTKFTQELAERIVSMKRGGKKWAEVSAELGIGTRTMTRWLKERLNVRAHWRS